jgi:hypothetical protein
MKNSMIRILIFWQAVTMLLASILWFINDDLDKWFERWSMGLILFGIYGIMKHIQKPNNE